MLDQTKEGFSPLVLRLIVGFGCMAHGWAKISRGTAGFEKLLSQQGVPWPHLNGMIAPYIELIGGFAILIGLYVVIAAVPLLLTMIVAMVFVQGHYGFSSVRTIGLTPSGPVFGPPGYEINLLYIAALISLMITGPGKLAVRITHLSRKRSAPDLHRPKWENPGKNS